MMPRVHRRLAPLAAVALVSAAAAADADKIIYPGATAQSAGAAASVGGGGVLTVVAFLLLAGAGAWLLWRGRGKTAPGHETRQLAIAETRSLGNRQYLVVASYEGKKFLLGVCPGRIDLLAPLDGPAALEKPRS